MILVANVLITEAVTMKMKMKVTSNGKKRYTGANMHIYRDLGMIKDAIFGATQDVRDKATSLIAKSYEDALEKSADIKHNVKKYVAVKPFKAIGIAALTGWCVGYLMRR